MICSTLKLIEGIMYYNLNFLIKLFLLYTIMSLDELEGDRHPKHLIKIVIS